MKMGTLTPPPDQKAKQQLTLECTTINLSEGSTRFPVDQGGRRSSRRSPIERGRWENSTNPFYGNGRGRSFGCFAAPLSSLAFSSTTEAAPVNSVEKVERKIVDEVSHVNLKQTAKQQSKKNSLIFALRRRIYSATAAPLSSLALPRSMNSSVSLKRWRGRTMEGLVWSK